MALTIKTERTAKRQLSGLLPQKEETAKVYQLTPARWPKHLVHQERYDIH